MAATPALSSESLPLGELTVNGRSAFQVAFNWPPQLLRWGRQTMFTYRCIHVCLPNPSKRCAFPCGLLGCCGCCSALRPRYKRLVDNIFPVNPEDGLVKSNMEKLTFYSLSSPDKLDRIGEYLYQKATKDINRKRYKWVQWAFKHSINQSID